MGTPARPAQLKRRRRPPAPALLHLRRPAQRLLLALRALRREQLLLRAPRAPPLLAADACPLGQSGLRHAARARLELVEQVAAREETVEGLRALALALDDHAGQPVAEHDTGGHLVDVLPALPAREGRAERQQGVHLCRAPPPADRRDRQVPARALAGPQPFPRAPRPARQARGARARRGGGRSGRAGTHPPPEAAALAAREGEAARGEAGAEREEGAAPGAGGGVGRGRGAAVFRFAAPDGQASPRGQACRRRGAPTAAPRPRRESRGLRRSAALWG